MKNKSLNKALVVLISILTITTLSACKSSKTDDPSLNYISHDQDECIKILFTCHQYQEQFINDQGCGCEEQEDKIDNPEARRIDNLVKSYLANKIFKPKNEGGVILAEFVAIGVTKEDKEMKYQTWAEIREYYYNAKDERTFDLLHRGPVILDITETGKNYIIHGNKLLDFNNKEGLAKELTKNALSWLNNEEVFKKTTTAIEKSIQDKSDSTLINGRIRVKVYDAPESKE